MSIGIPSRGLQVIDLKKAASRSSPTEGGALRDEESDEGLLGSGDVTVRS
jgi:hypothetical protein